ncbi:MAG: hypothetical protein WA231_03600 [Methylocella sp.]
MNLNTRFADTVAPNAMTRTFTVEGNDFSLTGYRVNSVEVKENLLVFAARGRAVKRERLARYVPGLERKIESDDGTVAAYYGLRVNIWTPWCVAIVLDSKSMKMTMIYLRVQRA